MLNQALFEEKHIGKMFMKIAIPGAIGMLASAIWNFRKRIFGVDCLCCFKFLLSNYYHDLCRQ